jgi:hypothetical protein
MNRFLVLIQTHTDAVGREHVYLPEIIFQTIEFIPSMVENNSSLYFYMLHLFHVS